MASLIVQIGEVVAHALEDLLGLGDEFPIGFGAAPPPRRALLRHGVLLGPLRARRAAPERRSCSSSGSKGFTRYASAPRPTPLSRSRSDPSVDTITSGIARYAALFSHERDQFEPVDVGHVDVGDDQVVGLARKLPQGVEAALRLGDLDGDVEILEGSRQQSPHRRGIFYDQDVLHGTPPAGFRRRIRPSTISVGIRVS